MASYDITYSSAARKALDEMPEHRQREIEAAIEQWAQNPPPSGRHTTHDVPVPGGRATCRVEHPSEEVYVITVLALV